MDDWILPMLTLGQAAKETGISKTTLSKAIAKGKLSATKNENGSYTIDPAELFRVFPRNSLGTVQSLRLDTPHADHEQQKELAVLRELLEAIKDERDHLRDERGRLLKVIEEQAGTVKQLTRSTEKKVGGWFGWLSGKK